MEWTLVEWPLKFTENNRCLLSTTAQPKCLDENSSKWRFTNHCPIFNYGPINTSPSSRRIIAPSKSQSVLMGSSNWKLSKQENGKNEDFCARNSRTHWSFFALNYKLGKKQIEPNKNSRVYLAPQRPKFDFLPRTGHSLFRRLAHHKVAGIQKAELDIERRVRFWPTPINGLFVLPRTLSGVASSQIANSRFALVHSCSHSCQVRERNSFAEGFIAAEHINLVKQTLP